MSAEFRHPIRGEMDVRRVVLDGDYERLQARHVVRYACESCSDEKERQRLGLATATG